MKIKAVRLISIIAILLSLVSIVFSIIAFWSSCKMEYDSGNAIMSAFSIMVTVLIGAVTVLIAWQVYNHYAAKDEVRMMVEEESLRIAEDIKLVFDSYKRVQNLFSFSSGDHKDLDAYMNGIEVAKQCTSITLRNFCIDNALNQFHHLYIVSKESGKMQITKGKRKIYEHLCSDINHKYIEELRDYITNAAEVENGE